MTAPDTCNPTGTTVEEDATFKIDVFLLPFTLLLWMTIVTTTVASGLVYNTLERLDQRSERGTLEKSPTKNAFLVAFVVFTGCLTFHPHTKNAQVFASLLGYDSGCFPHH